MNENQGPSTRPYLIRALFEWCMDAGFTPYLAVQAAEGVQVPFEFVNDGEIVLNISPDATSGLLIGNDWVEFKARFNGVARDIMVPVDHVLAIYARENGQGMAFPPPNPKQADLSNDPQASTPPDEPPPQSPKPALKRVK